MNELKIFENPKFGSVRTLEEDGKVLFCAKDVAVSLGYKDPTNAIKTHCRWVVKRHLPHPQNPSKEIEINFIPEGDIYRLAAKSELPRAEEFESWIFDEVIPSIRKHGAYMTPETIEKALLNPDTIIRLAMDIKAEREQRLLLEEKNAELEAENQRKQKMIESQKPMVEFAEKVGNSKDLITMSQMAKLVHDENIPLGRNKLLRWLRDKKILRENNEPYQQYVSSGLFDVKEVAKETTYGHKIFPVTLVTGKGQMYIVEKLRKEYAAG